MSGHLLEKCTGITSFQNLGDSSPQVTAPVVLFSVWRAPCPGIFQIQFQGSRFRQGSLEFSGVLGAANDFLPESFKFFCDFFFLLAFLSDGISYFFLPLFFPFHLKHRCIFSQYLIWNAFLSSKETLIVCFFIPDVIRADHIKLSEFKYQLTLLKSKAIFQLDKSPWFLIRSHITKLAAFKVLFLKLVVLHHKKIKETTWSVFWGAFFLVFQGQLITQYYINSLFPSPWMTLYFGWGSFQVTIAAEHLSIKSEGDICVLPRFSAERQTLPEIIQTKGGLSLSSLNERNSTRTCIFLLWLQEEEENFCDRRDSAFLQLKMGVLHVSVPQKLLEIPRGGTDRPVAKFLPLEIFRAELGKSLAQSDWLWSQPCLEQGVGLRSAECSANLNHSMHLWKKLYRSWHYREKCPSRTFSKPHKTGIITEFTEEHTSSQIRPF